MNNIQIFAEENKNPKLWLYIFSFTLIIKISNFILVIGTIGRYQNCIYLKNMLQLYSLYCVPIYSQQ